MSRFIVTKDQSKQYRWAFIAGNNEPLAVPGESFGRKEDALANIELVKTVAPEAPIHDLTDPASDGHHARGGTPEFEVYTDNAGEYRWRLQGGNSRILAASSEGYEKKKDCLHAIHLVKQTSPNAPVKDETGEGGFVKPGTPAVVGGGRFA